MFNIQLLLHEGLLLISLVLPDLIIITSTSL